MARVSVISTHPIPRSSSDVHEWHFPSGLESEITTLAAWCQAKQQQRDPLYDSPEDNDDDLDERIEKDVSTELLPPPSSDANALMKRNFLDELAEILCYDKIPALITSTALIYNDEEATIVAARNSTADGEVWSNKDIELLEYLAGVLEKVSSDDLFKEHPLPALKTKLLQYYSKRIQHHAKEIMRIEKGETGLEFFGKSLCGKSLCGKAASGQISLEGFVECVEYLSDDTDFYAQMKANLTPGNLRRVVDELAFIERPFTSANGFLRIAKQCSGFRNTHFILLNGPTPRKVKPWNLPRDKFSATPEVQQKFRKNVTKRKNVHAEMTLQAYLLDSGHSSMEVFPYLGISKKTCLLCGHILREIGQLRTRANHGKCYSQWTLPFVIWTNHDDHEKLRSAVQRIRDILWDEGGRDVTHMDAEKESQMAAPVPPRYERYSTLFNSVVEDPRFVAREVEWLSKFGNSDSNADSYQEDFHFQDAQDEPSLPQLPAKYMQSKKDHSTIPIACASCRDNFESAYSCEKCGVTSYCSRDCYRSDWYRHKFSCNLGRPMDATDYLVLACHTNKFPMEDEVARKYGFLCFSSGTDRSQLFALYQNLVTKWGLDEDELRSAIKLNKLKEMLISRCSQTRDPVMLDYMRWLESEEGFRVDGKGPDLSVLYDALREELLSPIERGKPIMDLQPREKKMAFVFYGQIRNGFLPDVDEDNWLSLGFCTTPDPESTQKLAYAYGLLVSRCLFDEFWNAMVESKVVELFTKYGLAGQISHMRNFKDFMQTVKEQHSSVWELKRFALTNVASPFRAVVVDYGFMNCDARQRLELRELYREYFSRGEDEMKLHEACVAGRLASFLESVMGKLTVPSDILRNYYPLKDYPLAGMVTATVIICTTSCMDHMEVLKEDDLKDGVVLTIPDDDYKAYMSRINDRAAFTGTGIGKRYRSGRNNERIMELSLS